MYEQYARRPVVGQRELAGVLPRLPARRRADRGRRRRRPPASTPAAPAAAPAPTAAHPVGGPRPTAEPPGEPLRGAAALHRRQHGKPASRCRPPPASARCRPGCSRSTAASSTATSAARGRGKVSFTHLIGYAVVKAISEHHPGHERRLRRGPRRQAPHRPPRPPRARPGRRRREGRRPHACSCRASRTPTRSTSAASGRPTRTSSARSATTSSRADDFAGVTVSLTNPGTIGTVQSVPRLMPGQGVIVGVGSLDYPTEFQGADPATLADLGVSKIITISSTYDHRIIQGAESGLFLKRVHELLLGADGFYEEIFRSIGVPYEAVAVAPRRQPDRPRSRPCSRSRCRSDQLVNAHRVRGHLIADLDPLAAEDPVMHPELDPATYGLTIWDLDREFLTGGIGGRDAHAARRHPRTCCATPTAARSASSTCTSRSRPRRRGSRSRSRTSTVDPRRRRAAPHPRAAQRGRGAREVPRHQVPRSEALRHRRRRVGHPDPRRRARRGRRRPHGLAPSWAWPTGAGSTCW